MTKKTIFSISLLLFFLILGIWAYVMSKNLMGDVEITGKEAKIGEEMTLQELIITETKEGEKFWEIYADSGYYHKGTDTAILSDITGNFYKEGNIIMSIASPKATYNSDKKQITLQNGAKAATNKDIYIEADEICWTGSKDLIKATGNVKIIRDKQVMTVSDKSAFDTDFTNLEISGDSNTYVFFLH